ncbi:MAG: hypothetical protein QXD77_00625 [Candidatus Aenigmatarchaeota archaeon]
MPRHRPPKHIRQRIQIQKQKDIARERIDILAKQVLDDPDSRFAQGWVKLMVKISRLSRIPLPNSVANRFCYTCYRFWVPGKNFTVRIKGKKPVLICACGKEWPLKQRVFR